jgi:hypothetical protein
MLPADGYQRCYDSEADFGTSAGSSAATLAQIYDNAEGDDARNCGSSAVIGK